MVSGYNNRVASVDLTFKDVSYFEPARESHEFFGGRGLGAALLSRRGPQVGALDERSVMCAGVGPLTGSGVPLANRLTFVFRSPQTGTIAWANTGGYAGAELKGSGLDALLVTGRSETPVYLLVQDSTVSIRDASGIWGLGAVEVVAKLRQVEGDSRVLAIGPAGENRVKFATVVNDTGRTSGVRHGLGCVMGDKKLKAIVIRGGRLRRVEPADRAAHSEHVRSLLSKIRQSQLLNHQTGSLAVHGTPIAAALLGRSEAMPVRNYQTTVFPDYALVGGEAMSRSVLVARLTCYNCPVECRRETASAEGRSFRVEGPDYAQISSLGTNCSVSDLRAIAYMNYLCYEYGLDPIEMGNQLALLGELTQRGLVSGGLRWGDVDAMIKLIGLTANREGVGETVGEGADRLAAEYGAPELSMTVKGISIQNVDPRAEQAWGLLNATENFGGAEHVWVHADLVPSMRGAGVPMLVSPTSTPWEVAKSVRYKQCLVAVLDSLQVCAFSGYVFSLEDYSTALRNITGERLSPAEVLEVGERIFELERRYNADNGFTRDDDTLPKRFLEEPLPEGGRKGSVCELGPMLAEYRALRPRGP